MWYSISKEINPQIILSPAYAIVRSPAVEKKVLKVVYAVTAVVSLIHVSIVEYHTYFDRLSAVSKATSESNGDPQSIRFLPSIHGRIRSITAIERTFAA